MAGQQLISHLNTALSITWFDVVA